MNSLHRSVASPNAWVAVLTAAGAVGVGCLGLGVALESEPLQQVGFVLVGPLVAGGVLLVTVAVPVLLAKNAGWLPGRADELVETLARLSVRVSPRAAVTFRSGPGERPPDPPAQIAFIIAVPGGRLTLPPAAAERYFSAAGRPPQFTLVLFAAGGGYEPAVQMSPAPSRGKPARVTLTLPEGEVREFIIPSGPPDSFESATSPRAEVLPESILDALRDGWDGTLELR